MPIFIKDFSWHQTDTKIGLILQLKTIKSATQVDIFIAEKYLKVSHSPHFFEAFLPHKIDVDKSLAVVNSQSSTINFDLVKLVPNKQWAELSLPDLPLEVKKAKVCL